MQAATVACAKQLDLHRGQKNDYTAEESYSEHYIPLNSARSGYATEGALFISAQLSTDTVSALQMFWVLIRLDAAESRHTRKHEVPPPWVKKKRLPLQFRQFGFYLCWHKQRGCL